ncbi:MAG: divalent-cation tolerance protein CutA [Clostridia bacterium]|nr:divalent-cation tolerance protein CutA [Clostridia bacterium]
MERYIIVTTLCKDKKIAEGICDTLLIKNLVAGCQVSRVDSKYWWDGNLEMAHEYKLEFRTVESFFDMIKDEITELHDYEVPEISAIELRDANDEFLEWVSQNTVESYSDDEEEEEESDDGNDFGLL